MGNIEQENCESKAVGDVDVIAKILGAVKNKRLRACPAGVLATAWSATEHLHTNHHAYLVKLAFVFHTLSSKLLDRLRS